MRKRIVAGNWKMHGSLRENQDLVRKLLDSLAQVDPVEVMVFPPAIYLSQLSDLLQKSRIVLGAQNVSAFENGAYTGEISAPMLQEFGVQTVLVGHSERRQLFAEDDVQIALKFAQAKHYQLLPILCVGETLAQREAGETHSVLFGQLDAILQMPQGTELLQGAVVAYEPVWAIGTGVTATPEQAQAVHEAIRTHIATYDVELSQSITLLYGGSVKSVNAGALFAMPDIDGGLIGGAALHAEEFIEIVQCMKSFC